jgi:hypothetical protein
MYEKCSRKILQIDKKDLKVALRFKQSNSNSTRRCGCFNTLTYNKGIADKPKGKETVKTEPSSASSYLTREQYNKNFNNPFIVGTAVWQASMKYWLDAYGEFLKNAPKMTEYWYDTYWKPWLNWLPQRQQQYNDRRAKIE